MVDHIIFCYKRGFTLSGTGLSLVKLKEEMSKILRSFLFLISVFYGYLTENFTTKVESLFFILLILLMGVIYIRSCLEGGIKCLYSVLFT